MLKFRLFFAFSALFVSASLYADLTNYEIEKNSKPVEIVEQVASEPAIATDTESKTEKQNIRSKFDSRELSIGVPCDKGGLNTLPDVGGRFMDVRTFAYRACTVKNWSLIVSCDVTENVREIKGKTIRESLNAYLEKTEFWWCLSGKCLYIASKHELEDFFVVLPKMRNKLPEGKKDGTFTGNFTFIELSLLCDFLCSVSHVNIKPVNDLQGQHVMMRVKDMNWKDLISAIICLNRFQTTITDYSVMIGPEPLN